MLSDDEPSERSVDSEKMRRAAALQRGDERAARSAADVEKPASPESLDYRAGLFDAAQDPRDMPRGDRPRRGLRLLPVEREKLLERAALRGVEELSGAPTIIAPRPAAPPTAPPRTPPAGYYGYEGPPRRSRSVWPWILVAILLAAAGVAAWLAYGKITDELNANKPVSVPYVVGLKQAQAVAKIQDKGLKAKVQPGPSNTFPVGTVTHQSIDGGEKTDKGNTVVLTVSNGRPKTTVPNVVDKSQSDAVAALTAAHLKVSVMHVYSSKTPDTVTAQDPPASSRVFWNTTVHINVSQGQKQIEIPNVVGQSYESARSSLLAAGLQVARSDVDSNQPTGTVIGQSPNAGTRVGAGTTVTLSVSRGSTAQTPVPDVTNNDEPTAKSILTGSGFKVKVTRQPVTDPSEQGIVLVQTPLGGTNAPAGSTVTITVGNYNGTTTGPVP